MARFNCKFCGYSLEKPNPPLSCPYCSKKEAFEQEENAEELISDV